MMISQFGSLNQSVRPGNGPITDKVGNGPKPIRQQVSALRVVLQGVIDSRLEGDLGFS